MSKIAVFDSGIGGITVLEELYKMLPSEDYIYLGDNLNVPYGDKTNEQIRVFTFKIIDFLLQNDVKIIVIACNTINSFLYKEIVNYVDIPVIGIIFPTVDYVNSLGFSRVGLFATVRTIENNAYQKMVEKELFTLKTPEFVPMIEDGSYKNKTEEVQTILQPLLDNKVDILILGCTHYPYLINQIKTFYNGIIVDSGYVTALELRKILKKRGQIENNGSVEICVTGEKEEFEFIIKDYVTFDYSIKKVEV